MKTTAVYERPLTKTEWDALTDWLLAAGPCRRTLCHTRAFLKCHHLPVHPVLTWLGRVPGRTCDCGVLFQGCLHGLHHEATLQRG